MAMPSILPSEALKGFLSVNRARLPRISLQRCFGRFVQTLQGAGPERAENIMVALQNACARLESTVRSSTGEHMYILIGSSSAKLNINFPR